MADILIDNQTAPTTPAASKSVIWLDSTTKKLVATDDSGIHRGILSHNQMVAASGNANAADTYVTNSGLLIPSFGIQVGMRADWVIHVSKTAAGTAAAILTLRIGTNQGTADTSVVALTQTVAQAATADSGILLVSAYVAVSGASGIVAACFQTPGTGSNFGSGKDAQSSTIDLTGRAGQYLGISINPGASGVWTWTGVWARLFQ